MTRVPTITDIARKTGSTGRPAFVTLTHVLTAPAPDRPDATRQNLTPDTVLFQRCCARTFNSHRTHSHLSCATGIEGFPAPVVHAPLRAIRMMNLANRLIGPATGFTCCGAAALALDHAVAVKTRKAAGRINLRSGAGTAWSRCRPVQPFRDPVRQPAFPDTARDKIGGHLDGKPFDSAGGACQGLIGV